MAPISFGYLIFFVKNTITMTKLAFKQLRFHKRQNN